MFFLKTRDGLISSRWIVQMKPNYDQSCWVVSYFDGMTLQSTTAQNGDARPFLAEFDPDPPLTV